jgi:hypothetical protein
MMRLKCVKVTKKLIIVMQSLLYTTQIVSIDLDYWIFLQRILPKTYIIQRYLIQK